MHSKDLPQHSEFEKSMILLRKWSRRNSCAEVARRERCPAVSVACSFKKGQEGILTVLVALGSRSCKELCRILFVVAMISNEAVMKEIE